MKKILIVGLLAGAAVLSACTTTGSTVEEVRAERGSPAPAVDHGKPEPDKGRAPPDSEFDMCCAPA